MTFQTLLKKRDVRTVTNHYLLIKIENKTTVLDEKAANSAFEVAKIAAVRDGKPIPETPAAKEMFEIDDFICQMEKLIPEQE